MDPADWPPDEVIQIQPAIKRRDQLKRIAALSPLMRDAGEYCLSFLPDMTDERRIELMASLPEDPSE